MITNGDIPSNPSAHHTCLGPISLRPARYPRPPAYAPWLLPSVAGKSPLSRVLAVVA